jgi:hypothetical protein
VIKGILYIEAQARDEATVTNALRELLEKLKGEENLTVERAAFEDVLVEDGNYSSVLEIEVGFQDFLTYLLTAIKYGPSAILILEPEKLLLDRKEFLKVVGEVVRVTKDFFEEYGVGYEFVGDEENEPEIGLTQDEIEDLLEEGALRVKIVVEMLAESEEKAIKSLLNAFEAEVMVNKVKTRAMESDDGFRGLVGVEAFVENPKAMFELAVKHRPVLFELIEPDEVELDILDIQDIGVDLAGVFFEASHKLMQRRP